MLFGGKHYKREKSSLLHFHDYKNKTFVFVYCPRGRFLKMYSSLFYSLNTEFSELCTFKDTWAAMMLIIPVSIVSPDLACRCTA